MSARGFRPSVDVSSYFPAASHEAALAGVSHAFERRARLLLRHRRRSIGGLTPERSGAEIVRYRSSDRAALTAAIDDWRFGEALALDAAASEALWADRVRAFWQVLDRAQRTSVSGGPQLPAEVRAAWFTETA